MREGFLRRRISQDNEMINILVLYVRKKASVENNRNGRICGNAPLGFRAPVRSRVRNGLRLAEPFRHPLCDTLTVKVIPGRFSFDSEEATTPKGRRVAVGFRPLFYFKGPKRGAMISVFVFGLPAIRRPRSHQGIALLCFHHLQFSSLPSVQRLLPSP